MIGGAPQGEPGAGDSAEPASPLSDSACLSRELTCLPIHVSGHDDTPTWAPALGQELPWLPWAE